MYQKILAGLDGSAWSNYAIEAAVSLAQKNGLTQLIGCHVYAAELHRERFEQMEPGLPEQYQAEEKLNSLRGTHESLIPDGMVLISDSYLAPLLKKAQQQQINVSGLIPEGKNYAVLLKEISSHQPDLTILGAMGHGAVPEARLGSLTERVLLFRKTSDLLILRQPWVFKNRPVVVGIDGSQNSYLALTRAIQIAQAYQTTVEAVAVYDPFFHVGVFRVIADALPEADQKRFDFPAQEQLHDEIIDKGLEKLYREGLERGVLLAEQMGVKIRIEVIAGKVYPQLHHYAQMRNAGLIVVGQTGLHWDPISFIGSNTLQLARINNSNLLVVNPPKKQLEIPELPKQEEVPLSWTPQAEERLKRIPFFARAMAKRSIEDQARQQGLAEVTEEFVKEKRSMMK
jgi:nucleotide-binding universal stress UspA family protein